MYRELDNYRRLIKEPSRDKLLPVPLQYPHLQPKYTLVLELTDVLVHPNWTYNTGWRFKKRSGLEYFLDSLQGHFEIVIYTAEQGMTMFPLIEVMDPKNIIAYNRRRQGSVALLQQVRRSHRGVSRKAQEIDGAAGGARRRQEGRRGETKAAGLHDLL
ncbi:hypothetical protein GEV33_002028 [Tenebrio molitor]|uniref:FCP1 homology domain-containing protein n=1 Tax=Tenebrio molitor TaxID=7067 RepID=A0A8J6LJ27_TENMO|nr:hypothetical protein GEV33_002028 [Tenebrio molitor]